MKRKPQKKDKQDSTGLYFGLFLVAFFLFIWWYITNSKQLPESPKQSAEVKAIVPVVSGGGGGSGGGSPPVTPPTGDFYTTDFDVTDFDNTSNNS